MSYAIIRTGGKQYRVSEGQCLQVEKLAAEVGAQVELTEVLAVGDGASLSVGAPLLEGKKVTATVVRHGRGHKIRIWKFKRRKGFDRRQGHRQDFTEIRITGLPA